MTARTAIEPARTPNAAMVNQREARESGLDAANVAGPAAVTAARDSTNDPVATPAQAGRTTPGAAKAARERRPLARRTACPTVAANAIARSTVPMANRACVANSMGASAVASETFDAVGPVPPRRSPVASRQAAAAPPGGGPAGCRAGTVRSMRRTSPHVPQVSIHATRPVPHFGHATERSRLQVLQRVSPGG